jgi:exonuclease III
MLQKCGRDSEIEKIYYNKGIQEDDRPEFIKCIYDNKNRSAILIKYKGILIANVHMEGGRYMDEMFCNSPNEMQERKMILLHNVLKEKPDIIVGDFNSVYSSNETQFERFILSQNNYFKEICRHEIPAETILKWNKEPFDELLKNGYQLAVPNNETLMITNARGQTIVDMIWYKPDSIQLNNTQIFPLMKDGDSYDRKSCVFSDHNPVFTTVSLRYRYQ